MKRLIHIFLLSIYFMTAMGQYSRNISLKYDYDDFRVEEKNGLLSILSSPKLWATFKEDTSQPALPYISVDVLIGANEILTDVSYSKKERLVKNGVDVVSNPEIILTNESFDSQIASRSMVYTKSEYPAEVVENFGASMVDGYQVVGLLVCPFRYDAANRQLFFIDSLVITLNLTAKKMNTDKAVQGVIGNNMRGIVKNMVVNPEDMDNLYARNLKSVKSQRSTSTSEPNYEYIIVTRDSLKSAFQELASWKTTKGVRAKVLTIEEIEQNYTGRNLPLKIKYALKDYYDGTHTGLKYVLLGGDVEIVPTQGCYGKLFLKGGNKIDTNIPTDLFYACFTTMDWDYNNNQIYAESMDKIDYHPDVFVTRLSVACVDDIINMTRRIKLYEMCRGANIYDIILMCGSQLNSNFIVNGQSITDAQYYGNLMYNNYILPYWGGDKVDFYDADNYWMDNVYTFSAPNLQSELSSGYPFINIDTHGSPTSFQMQSLLPSYTITDALNMNNEKSMSNAGAGVSHIVTSACLTNAFDSVGVCLSEAFMRNPNSGVLTYVGSSRYGVFYADSMKLGPSDLYNAKFYEFMFSNQAKPFSEIMAETKMFYYKNSYILGSFRWLQFGLNPLGDPEMPIYTNPPKLFTCTNITYQNNRLYVETNVDSCEICVTSMSDCGNAFFKVISNVSSYSFVLPNNTYNICVKKNGYAPSVISFCNDSYIQNKIFNNDVKVVTNHLSIGSDVTSLKPEGPVSLEQGKMSVKSHKGVYIKNNFEVKLGTEFSIEINN